MPGMNGKGPRSGGQRGDCNQTEITKPDQSQETPNDAMTDQGQGQGQCGSGRCGGGGGHGRHGGGGGGGGKGQGRCGNR